MVINIARHVAKIVSTNIVANGANILLIGVAHSGAGQVT
jgi:hypothetical protein